MSYSPDTTYFGAMPNQAEGTLNGRCFYFRGRWGYWTLRVAGDDGNAVHGEVIDEGGDGSTDGGGWWTEDETRAFVLALLEKHSK